MTNYEIPKNCPKCPNHCSVELLRCMRGRQWLMIFMSQLKEKIQAEEKLNQ